jgi:hypothetical protein
MSLVLLDLAAPARDQPFAAIQERAVMEITPPAPSPTPPIEAAHSSAREKVLEHLFVGELLRCLWRRGIRNMEVLRAEVDMGGYDLVLEANKVLRYVQLKFSHRTSATANVPVNVNLEGKPGGCVVWMKFDPETVELGPYLWFGQPGRARAFPGLEDRPSFQGRQEWRESLSTQHPRVADRAVPKAQ